jgi:hypothetical protein
VPHSKMPLVLLTNRFKVLGLCLQNYKASVLRFTFNGDQDLFI